MSPQEPKSDDANVSEEQIRPTHEQREERGYVPPKLPIQPNEVKQIVQPVQQESDDKE